MVEFFGKLTSLIKNYKTVIIMTHSNPDLDGLSASICLYRIIETFNIKCFLYEGDSILNRSVTKMYEKLKENDIIINKVNKNNYKEYISDNTLLVILDVNNVDLVENSDLIDLINDVVVIDHHIKSSIYIKKTILIYQNSNLSSIAELMTLYTKYLNKTPSPVLATILLTAIEIDTNGFHIKTTESTYNVAAYLTKIGADNTEKQELLKEDKEEYIKKQDFIKDSYMIDSIALCVLDKEIYQKADLASISEELLQFEDVEAAITIGKIDLNNVGVSSRSIGNINVLEIMKKIGGGGHIYEAAAELPDISIKEVVKKVENILKER